MEAMTQRPQIAFKVTWEVFRKLEKFKAEHPLIPSSTIYNKALDFYLAHAEHGVDAHLNPVAKKR